MNATFKATKLQATQLQSYTSMKAASHGKATSDKATELHEYESSMITKAVLVQDVQYRKSQAGMVFSCTKPNTSLALLIKLTLQSVITMNPVYAIAMVFAGCCSNVIFLELLIREHPGCGNLVTFAQFLFISIEGFIFAADFGTKKSVIPIRKYLTMVFFFFTVSVVNNYAMNFNISTPLQMIFRSGSLVANMTLGIIILKKEYPPSKFMSVFMISAGIFICTLMSAKGATVPEDSTKTKEESAADYLSYMFIGVGLLTVGLFLSARMGIFQEVLYKEYGKHPREALFYSHALPLPGFLLLGKDIFYYAQQFNASEPVTIPLLEADVPKFWLFLLGNIITQYVCIRGVFILTTECPSLIVTLVVTLRKFVSLVFSIIYFNNPFTVYHWIGAALVFGGTFIFTGILQKLVDFVSPPSTITTKSSAEKKVD